MANLAVDNLIATLGSGPARGTPPTALNPEVLSAGRHPDEAHPCKRRPPL
jgi:hypothetical protein